MSILRFGGLFVLAAGALLITPAYGREMLEVGTQVQLFLDEFVIEKAEWLQPVLHQPVRHAANPLLQRDVPWESWGNDVVSALRGPGDDTFRMWYRAIAGFGIDKYSDRGATFHVCLATSADGVSWVRPDLGLVEFDGSKHNNILPGGAGRIFVDPSQRDPTKRFATLGYWSQDGVSWTGWAQQPEIEGKPGGGSVVYNPNTGVWRLYGQNRFPRESWTRHSRDLVHWSGGEPALAADGDDPAGTEIYCMTVYRAGDLYIGLAHMYHTWPNPDPGRPRQSGWIDVQLATSRDGVHWRRAGERATFFRRGDEGAFDYGMVFMVTPPIPVGDQLYFYYGGWDDQHGTKYRRSGTGLATLRRDGYLSLFPVDDWTQGVLVTKAMRVAGEGLQVNANVLEGGEMRVEVLDAEGEVLPGFSREQCQAVRCDRVDHVVAWQGADLSSLEGQTIRLRFLLRRTHLFAFRFAAAGGREVVE